VLAERIAFRLSVPLIAAPMLKVSGPDLVIAACRAGVIGAFPTANAGSLEALEDWLVRITAALAAPTSDGRQPALWCPNLIIHRDPEALQRDVEAVLRHRAEMVITSVGSPAPVVGPLKEGGCLVFADVATLRHAHKAIRRVPTGWCC
jgi:nitronate monooxygenase